MFEKIVRRVHNVRGVSFVQKDCIMKPLSTSEARETFANVVNLVAFGKCRQVVHRHGKNLVAIVPVEDLEKLELYEDLIDVEAAKKEFKNVKRGTKKWTDLKRELGL